MLLLRKFLSVIARPKEEQKILIQNFCDFGCSFLDNIILFWFFGKCFCFFHAESTFQFVSGRHKIDCTFYDCWNENYHCHIKEFIERKNKSFPGNCHLHWGCFALSERQTRKQSSSFGWSIRTVWNSSRYENPLFR